MEGENKNNIHHESAGRHVNGSALYVNDLDFDKILYGHIIYSPHASAIIKSIDTSEAEAVEGVYAVMTYKDIPGSNKLGAVVHDEECLASNEVLFIGQAIAIIAGRDEETAIHAAGKVIIEYELVKPLLTIKEAIKESAFIKDERCIETGSISDVFHSADHILQGSLETGAQDHWYLETQSAVALFREDELKVYSSTQHPSETQALLSHILGIPRNSVQVEVLRLGGAFGGKETQATHIAAYASLLAGKTGRPVKVHLKRKADMEMTGKRHPFYAEYKAAYDDEGKILAAEIKLFSDGGSSLDLSMAIMQRAMFHVDNAYYIPNLKVTGRICRTNNPSNTAFRGFGGPQGMAVTEEIIDSISRRLGKDPAKVRKLNFYDAARNITHYGQKVENIRLDALYSKLFKSSEYEERRASINKFNNSNNVLKRGMALTPVKFGISFTTAFLNQAGALVNIYQDGTVLVHHGGVEMGQGLNTKMLGIAAAELGIPHGNIRIHATDTNTIPNTSATSASSGSDLNGMAIKDAILKLKTRLKKVAIEHFLSKGIPATNDDIVFIDGKVINKNNKDEHLGFKELIKKAYLESVSLSATGYYSTPGIHFDSDTGKGNPFHYYAFGMAVSEVELDVLKGRFRITRTDILHDAGRSINEKIDIGQVIGGYIQGVGWCTTEELVWNDKGQLLTNSPDTYKIPTICDIPEDFRVELLKDAPNPNTIRQSKAVGEPPFMLCFSVWLAIKDAVSAIGDHKTEPSLGLPATNEKILLAINEIIKETGNTVYPPPL